MVGPNIWNWQCSASSQIWSIVSNIKQKLQKKPKFIAQKIQSVLHNIPHECHLSTRRSQPSWSIWSFFSGRFHLAAGVTAGSAKYMSYNVISAVFLSIHAHFWKRCCHGKRFERKLSQFGWDAGARFELAISRPPFQIHRKSRLFKPVTTTHTSQHSAMAFLTTVRRLGASYPVHFLDRQENRILFHSSPRKLNFTNLAWSHDLHKVFIFLTGLTRRRIIAPTASVWFAVQFFRTIYIYIYAPISSLKALYFATQFLISTTTRTLPQVFPVFVHLGTDILTCLPSAYLHR